MLREEDTGRNKSQMKMEAEIEQGSQKPGNTWSPQRLAEAKMDFLSVFREHAPSSLDLQT